MTRFAMVSLCYLMQEITDDEAPIYLAEQHTAMINASQWQTANCA